MTTINSIIVVTLKSITPLQNRFSESAEVVGVANINGKDLELAIISRYESTSYSQRREAEANNIDLPDHIYNVSCVNNSSNIESSLKLVGITFDYSQIIDAHKVIVEKKKLAEAEAKQTSFNAYWKSLHVEEYLQYISDNSNLNGWTYTHIDKKTYYASGVEIPFTISLTEKRTTKHSKDKKVSFKTSADVKLTLYPTHVEIQKDTYNSKGIRKVKRSFGKVESITLTAVFLKLKGLLNQLHQEDLYKLEFEYDRKQAALKQSDEFGYRVKEFKSGYYDGSRKWISTNKKAFILKIDKRECVGVEFSAYKDVYHIESITGKIKKETMKKILDLLKKEAELDSDYYLTSED